MLFGVGFKKFIGAQAQNLRGGNQKMKKVNDFDARVLPVERSDTSPTIPKQRGVPASCRERRI